MLKKRLIRWVILLALGFGIGSAIGLYQGTEEIRSDAIELSPDDKKPEGKYNFTLTDHNGKEVTQDDYADTYKLIFFGFTFCPAVCPTELQKMNIIMSELGDLSVKITPIFISIDPNRDTVEVINSYVEQFDPRLVGLTGTQEQINAVKKAFHVFARKVESDMMESYMFDHSSFLYFMGKNNELIAMYPAKDGTAKISSNIRNHLIAKE